MFGPCFVIQYSVSLKCCNHLYGEKRVGCFTLIVFLMSCGSVLSLFLTVPCVGLQCVIVVFPIHINLLF